jgi:transposase
MGYAVHLTETCDQDAVHLVAQVKTTPASVAEAKCTEAIQHTLVDQGWAPGIRLKLTSQLGSYGDFNAVPTSS